MAQLLVNQLTPRQPDAAPQFKLAGWIDTAPFEDLVGIEIVEASKGRATLTMKFPVRLAMGGGFMHGGAITTLADTAVAMAIKTLLPEGTVFATTELTTRFFAPVTQGAVRAEASVRGPQGREFFGEATVFDAQGKEVAHFSSVFRVARGQGIGE